MEDNMGNGATWGIDSPTFAIIVALGTALALTLLCVAALVRRRRPRSQGVVELTSADGGSSTAINRNGTYSTTASSPTRASGVEGEAAAETSSDELREENSEFKPMSSRPVERSSQILDATTAAAVATVSKRRKRFNPGLGFRIVWNDAPSAAQNGRITFSRYETVKPLGQGSFGTAYLLRHRRTGNMVVSKQVAVRAMAPPELTKVENEVRILSALSHAHIIAYHCSFQCEPSTVSNPGPADEGLLASKSPLPWRSGGQAPHRHGLSQPVEMACPGLSEASWMFGHRHRSR